jgi:hypothetical protein
LSLATTTTPTTTTTTAIPVFRSHFGSSFCLRYGEGNVKG